MIDSPEKDPAGADREDWTLSVFRLMRFIISRGHKIFRCSDEKGRWHVSGFDTCCSVEGLENIVDSIIASEIHTYAFKPSHYTRGKDGAPGPVVGPLSADADKGDQESVVCVQGTMDPCTDENVAFALGRNGGQENAVGQPAISFERRMVRTTGGQPQSDLNHCLRSDSNSGDGAPCVSHAMSVRRLTPTECERLQGFPDGWTEGFSDSTRYKMLGNAVCVNVSEWIAKRMMGVWKKIQGDVAGVQNVENQAEVKV